MNACALSSDAVFPLYLPLASSSNLPHQDMHSPRCSCVLSQGRHESEVLFFSSGLLCPSLQREMGEKLPRDPALHPDTP